MIVYMVVQQRKDGTTEIRVGGGSSSPSIPRVYESLPRALAYISNKESMYIHKIDLDKQEIITSA